MNSKIIAIMLTDCKYNNKMIIYFSTFNLISKMKKSRQKERSPITKTKVEANVQKKSISQEIRNKRYVKFIVICTGSVLLLHTVQKFYGGDPLAIGLINGPYVSIDSWSIIHVITFLILGMYESDRLIEFMLYGCLWELLEQFLAGLPEGDDFWSERLVNTLWDIWFNFSK
jgi:hypothetical protein